MSYDWVIVGGGSAGAVLAARLSEQPDRRVLLLEAGATGPLGGDADRLSNVTFGLTPRDWGLRVAVTRERVLDYPQGKFLGGGSSVNGALAVRPAPADLDGWAAAGNPSWSWERMLPAFCRLERDVDFGDAPTHGADGPIPVQRWRREELLPVQAAFAQACMDDGLPWADDHNDPEATGVGPMPMNRWDGQRISTAIGYLDPIRDRPNLTIVGEAQVDRVVIDGGRARAVSYLAGGRREQATGGEIVLAAGSFGSPSILWRSGVGPAGALGALGIDCQVDNPAVGAHLQDHPGVSLLFEPGRRGPDLSAPQHQLGARYTSGAGAPANDMLLAMMNFWDLTLSPDFAAAVGAPLVVAVGCGVHQPTSRGSLSLVSADPAVPPAVSLNLLSEPGDVDLLLAGLARCREVAASPHMADFVGRCLLLDAKDFDDRAALESYARSMVAPWYHPVGTCRMGPAGNDSVVGDDLRVHGVDGLRVADASVMPGIVRAPTNLTAIAIGEHAAELLAAG